MNSHLSALPAPTGASAFPRPVTEIHLPCTSCRLKQQNGYHVAVGNDLRKISDTRFNNQACNVHRLVIGHSGSSHFCSRHFLLPRSVQVCALLCICVSHDRARAKARSGSVSFLRKHLRPPGSWQRGTRQNFFLKQKAREGSIREEHHSNRTGHEFFRVQGIQEFQPGVPFGSCVVGGQSQGPFIQEKKKQRHEINVVLCPSERLSSTLKSSRGQGQGSKRFKPLERTAFSAASIGEATVARRSSIQMVAHKFQWTWRT